MAPSVQKKSPKRRAKSTKKKTKSKTPSPEKPPTAKRTRSRNGTPTSESKTGAVPPSQRGSRKKEKAASPIPNKSPQITPSVEDAIPDTHPLEPELAGSKHVTDDDANEDVNVSAEINSSPIKKEPRANEEQLSSSPIRKRKAVAFSDDLTSDVPSTPDFSGMQTPVKSILKPCELMQHLSPAKQVHDENFKPNTPGFWSSGTIVQLDPESTLLEQLINGCVTVLGDKTFSKKFEVYATLNYNFRINKAELVTPILVGPQKRGSPSKLTLSPMPERNLVSCLTKFVQRDISIIEPQLVFTEENKENQDVNGKGDPFSIRILSQGLKLVSGFMFDTHLNNYIPVDEARWFYSHAATEVVKPTISKSLIIPYVGILKDCKFSVKRKRLIFNTINRDIAEDILFALLNMKTFPSSSLVMEKFQALKNLVINFPNMMANHFKHWFEMLIINLCDSSSPLYSKVIGTGILTLLEAAKAFLNDKNVIQMTRAYLDSSISTEPKSICGSLDLDSLESVDITSTNFDLVVSGLEVLISSQRYKTAMDMWVALSLMCCDKNEGFIYWKQFPRWFNVYRSCLMSKDRAAKTIAISSWKAIIYNLCVGDLDKLNIASETTPTVIPEDVKAKFEVLTRPLTLVDLSDETLADAVDGCVMNCFYTLINQATFNNNNNLNVYWDHLIDPILNQIYFGSKSAKQLNFYGIKLINNIIKKVSVVTDKNFHSIRCLANDGASIDEINSFSTKWLYFNYRRILPIIKLVTQSDQFRPGLKFNTIALYMKNIKPLAANRVFPISKEVEPIVYNILRNQDLEPGLLFKIFVCLTESLGPISLCGIINTPVSTHIFNTLLTYCKSSLDEDGFLKIVDQVTGAIEVKDRLPFLAELLNINESMKSNKLLAIVVNHLNKCKVNVSAEDELKLIGYVFERITDNYNVIAKSLIQSLVLLKEADLEKALNRSSIQAWSLPIFKFFVILVHDAPLNHLKQLTFNLILLRWESDDTFVNMIQFLVEQKFDLELFNLRKPMMKRFDGLNGYFKFEFRRIWKSYLESLDAGKNFVLLDPFLVECIGHDIDVKSIVDANSTDFPLTKERLAEDSTAMVTEFSSENSQPDESPFILEESKEAEQAVTVVGDAEERTELDQASDESEDNTFSADTNEEAPADESFNSEVDELRSISESGSASKRASSAMNEMNDSPTKKAKAGTPNYVETAESVDEDKEVERAETMYTFIHQVEESLPNTNASCELPTGKCNSTTTKVDNLVQAIRDFTASDLKVLSKEQSSTLHAKMLGFLLGLHTNDDS